MIRETREGGGRENEKDSIHQKSLAGIYITGEGGPESSVKFKHVLFSFFFLKEVWINYNRIHLILCIFFSAFSNQIRNLHVIITAKRQIFKSWMDGVGNLNTCICLFWKCTAGLYRTQTWRDFDTLEYFK